MNKGENRNGRRALPALLLGLILVAACGAYALTRPPHIAAGGGSSPLPLETPSESDASSAPAGPSAPSAASESAATIPVAREPGRALIVFTFDDGYISDYNCAWPILKKHGIHGTSYIIGKLPDNNTPNTLSWAQIKEMAAWGWDFGCHTYNHVDMTTLTAGEIRESLIKEDRTFVDHGLPVPEIMAYPSGKFNQQVIDVVKQYRKQARLAFYDSKFVDLNHVNPYEIDSISADMQEEPRLKSREALVDKACREDAVIVFRTHCMYFQHKDDNGKWDVQTDSRLFAQLVQYCVNKGCQFMTMSQLMQLYSSN